MAKLRKLTPQEAMVAAFTRHSISGYSTFHPRLFGNGREPADMVVVVGRALIFVNMHSGKSYFDDLCVHNLNQARDRIEEWKGGKPIRGENGKAKFHLSWSDVDFIHVVSVIDGPHAACSGHQLSSLAMEPKVRLVTTLTSAVMNLLAKLGGGARDLIAVSREIEQVGKISENHALQLVQTRHDRLLSEAMSVVPRLPNRQPPAVHKGRPLSHVDEHLLYIEQVRRLDSAAALAFVDLSWEDVFKIVAHIIGTLASIEWLESGYVSADLFETMVKFIVVISTNMECLSERSEQIYKYAAKCGARFVYSIAFVDFGTLPLFALATSVSPLATEIELGGAIAFG